MIDFAPGMRTIIRDEEWMIKKIEINSLGNKTQTVDKPLIRDSKASRKSFILTQIYLQNRDMNNFITRLEKLLRTQEKSCC